MLERAFIIFYLLFESAVKRSTSEVESDFSSSVGKSSGTCTAKIATGGLSDSLFVLEIA